MDSDPSIDYLILKATNSHVSPEKSKDCREPTFYTVRVGKQVISNSFLPYFVTSCSKLNPIQPNSTMDCKESPLNRNT